MEKLFKEMAAFAGRKQPKFNGLPESEWPAALRAEAPMFSKVPDDIIIRYLHLADELVSRLRDKGVTDHESLRRYLFEDNTD